MCGLHGAIQSKLSHFGCQLRRTGCENARTWHFLPLSAHLTRGWSWTHCLLVYAAQHLWENWGNTNFSKPESNPTMQHTLVGHMLPKMSSSLRIPSLSFVIPKLYWEPSSITNSYLTPIITKIAVHYFGEFVLFTWPLPIQSLSINFFSHRIQKPIKQSYWT